MFALGWRWPSDEASLGKGEVSSVDMLQHDGAQELVQQEHMDSASDDEDWVYDTEGYKMEGANWENAALGSNEGDLFTAEYVYGYGQIRPQGPDELVGMTVRKLLDYPPTTISFLSRGTPCNLQSGDGRKSSQRNGHPSKLFTYVGL